MKLLVVVGTRPEAIKMAPVIRSLRAEPDARVVVCATAQHREMLDQVFALFEIAPDIDLDLMRPDQTPNALASRVFAGLDDVLARETPDWLLVQGDTTTAMAASVAAFHRRVRVGHVEAGLRTGDFQHPFPEEMNRRVVDLVSDANFVPTRARRAGARGRGGPAGKDPPDRQHGRGRASGDRRARRGDPGRGPRPHHGSPAGELRRAARTGRAGDRTAGGRVSRDAFRARHSPEPQRPVGRPGQCEAAQRDARRAPRLPRARPADAPGAPDPHGLGRDPGGGSDVRQARSRPAREDRAAGRRRSRPRPLWSAPTRRRSSPRPGIFSRMPRPGAGWPASTPTETARPPAASRRS